MNDVAKFALENGLTFNNPDLLIEAFTHRSYLNENRGHAGNHNERLEFLGDAVLELAVTAHLFRTFAEIEEGELTSYRAALVNTVSLAEIARSLGVGEHLFLSKGEARDTGRAREVILADALEAIIGAIYLDQGYGAAESFVLKNFFNKLDDIIAKRAYQDAKSRFQEIAQEKRGVTPHYETLSEAGPDHAKVFTVGIFILKEEIARGDGASKQEAEQVAAQNALIKMGW